MLTNKCPDLFECSFSDHNYQTFNESKFLQGYPNIDLYFFNNDNVNSNSQFNTTLARSFIKKISQKLNEQKDT